MVAFYKNTYFYLRMAGLVSAVLMVFLGTAFANLSGQWGQWQQSQFDITGPNNTPYRIFVAVPSQPAPQQGWPIIWILDGNSNFDIALQSNAQAMIVGIGYATEDRDQIVRQRYFDLTEKAVDISIPHKAGQAVPVTGGEEQFRAFLTGSLTTRIAADYPVDVTQQTLYGHSLGGLFALKSFLNAPSYYQSICMADPAIWWHFSAVLDDLALFIEHPLEKIDTHLLIENAQKHVQHQDLSAQDYQKIQALRSGPNGRFVYHILQDHNLPHITYRAFEEHSHGSMIPQSIDDCIHFAQQGTLNLAPSSQSQGENL